MHCACTTARSTSVQQQPHSVTHGDVAVRADATSPQDARVDPRDVVAASPDARTLTSDGGTAPGTPRAPFALATASNLARLGTLTERQQRLLTTQGFFLAPVPPPVHRHRRSAVEAYEAQAATHLFHVYERNDYIRFPSFVTVDVAIDSTHAYFDALLRDLESRNLVPLLRTALRGLVRESERVRAAATNPDARAVALRVETYWAVALRLLDQPAAHDAPEREVVRNAAMTDEDVAPEIVPPPSPSALPAAVRPEVARLVTRVHEAQGVESPGVTDTPVDLSQMRPRGHYGRTGVLQRFFRSMSWLGMIAFPVEGDHADVPAVALLARSALGADAARRGLERIVELTAFFVGGPDSSGLTEACTRLETTLPGAATATADAILATTVIDSYRTALAGLTPPRITSGAGAGARQIRVAGRRAFEDAVALQALTGPVRAGAQPPRESIPRVFGALGAAAVLGSDPARALVTAAMPDRTSALDAAVTAARAAITLLPSQRWESDGYHGTIHALRALLDPRPPTSPSLVQGAPWQLRAVFAFAGGWAELRHDTILYGEQLGVECDAGETPPPPSWVEPVPEVYTRLAAMVRGLDRRLRDAHIPMEQTPDGSPYASPLATKTQLMLSLLDLLRECAEREVRGEPLTAAQLARLTTIGGEMEWLLITLANTDLLSERDRQMAIVADVFTWNPTGEVVEVGVAHPDLMYAVVPTPRGPVIARGAVMSYREFLHPMSDRLTDETWRRMLATGPGPARPAWVDDLYAEPVRAITPSGPGVSRCGPSSGAGLPL